MKNRPRLAISFFGFLGCSLAMLATPAAAEDGEAILIDASGENFAIDGNEFPVGPTVDALVRLWGEPDRIRKGVNHVRIWDDLGIRAYSSPASPSVESLT